MRIVPMVDSFPSHGAVHFCGPQMPTLEEGQQVSR